MPLLIAFQVYQITLETQHGLIPLLSRFARGGAQQVRDESAGLASASDFCSDSFVRPVSHTVP